MKRSHGKMVGSTRNLGKHKKKLTVNDIVKTFNVGERVVLDIQSNYHEGMPHPRYNGRAGIIKGMQGRAYIVEIADGNKNKKLIVPAVHLKQMVCRGEEMGEEAGG